MLRIGRDDRKAGGISSVGKERGKTEGGCNRIQGSDLVYAASRRRQDGSLIFNCHALSGKSE